MTNIQQQFELGTTEYFYWRERMNEEGITAKQIIQCRKRMLMASKHNQELDADIQENATKSAIAGSCQKYS